jgi:hypothetical protein
VQRVWRQLLLRAPLRSKPSQVGPHCCRWNRLGTWSGKTKNNSSLYLAHERDCDCSWKGRRVAAVLRASSPAEGPTPPRLHPPRCLANLAGMLLRLSSIRTSTRLRTTCNKHPSGRLPSHRRVIEPFVLIYLVASVRCCAAYVSGSAAGSRNGREYNRHKNTSILLHSELPPRERACFFDHRSRLGEKNLSAGFLRGKIPLTYVPGLLIAERLVRTASSLTAMLQTTKMGSKSGESLTFFLLLVCVICWCLCTCENGRMTGSISRSRLAVAGTC